MPINHKLVLCVPHGGLNDTLCQIEKCWRYAERFGRRVVLDDTKCALMGMFREVFTVKPPGNETLLANLPDYDQLNRLDCVPPEVRGRLDSVDGRRSAETNAIHDVVSGARLTFDFDREYGDAVLLHEQSGGGSASRKFLNRVSLSPWIRAQAREVLGRLPERYLAVHVRNTDYRTDYQSAFDALRRHTEGRDVVVCSDDSGVIEAARESLGSASVHSTMLPVRTDGRPIHHGWHAEKEEYRRRAVTSMLVDLLVLASADELLLTRMASGAESGYGKLAGALHRHRHILEELLR